ncbi:hypothetical protein [Microbulbifer celer]|uniref:Uncharacterized protein n=1 Tax=Microbulbifer celer TaxID=435905 RepID=A0ABW3U945_9GAMM|nr:hypothetical protein [Microbulbifer celer]UFN58562.1 hypothetical protein LPW13_05835 [Microbulbifer celer]
MTVTNLSTALERIEKTDPSSPLACFRARVPGSVNTMFAGTVLTQRRIEQGDINYLGTFHRDNLPEAREKLREYVSEAA